MHDICCKMSRSLWIVSLSYVSSSVFVIFNLVCGHQLLWRTLFSNFLLELFTHLISRILYEIIFIVYTVDEPNASASQISFIVVILEWDFLVIFRWIFCYFLDCHCKVCYRFCSYHQIEYNFIYYFNKKKAKAYGIQSSPHPAL